VVILVHTSLGSSYLIAHVLHYPPPPHAHSFVKGTAVLNNKKKDRSILYFFWQWQHLTKASARRTLVVSRSTCPPVSLFPHANSFVIGTAVINTHTHLFQRHLETGLGWGLNSRSHSSSHALPFFSPPSFHTLALSPAFPCVH